jgi:hypothetical protein
MSSFLDQLPDRVFALTDYLLGSSGTSEYRITGSNLIAGLGLITGTGGAPWSPSTSTLPSLAVLLDPDTIAGNDGDALSSVTPIGTADAFTQPTSAFQPVLKKGANGINGHNVILADGLDDTMATTVGGATLSGDWFIAVIINLTSTPTGSNVVDPVSWGTDAANERRQPLIGGPTFWNTSPGFTNSGATLAANSAVAATTTYMLEYKSVGGVVTITKNGAQIASGTIAQSAYASTVIRLFTNPSGSGECPNGKLGYLVMMGVIPNATTLSQLRGFLATRFSITVAGASPTGLYLPVWASAGVLGDSILFESSAGNLILGGGGTLVTQGTGITPNNAALLSVNGVLAVSAGAAESLIQNKWPDENVVGVQSLDNTGGLSTIHFIDHLGNEVCAIGRGNTTSDTSLDGFPFYTDHAATRPLGMFLETSTNGSTSAAATEWLVCQTGTLNSITGYHRRIRCDAAGNIILYKVDSAFPNESPGLTITPGGSVEVGTTIATTATAGHFKMPTCAGTPTGTPEGGNGCTVYDTSANKIWVYNGTWKGVAVS